MKCTVHFGGMLFTDTHVVGTSYYILVHTYALRIIIPLTVLHVMTYNIYLFFQMYYLLQRYRRDDGWITIRTTVFPNISRLFDGKIAYDKSAAL
jgi:hypothetical protein